MSDDVNRLAQHLVAEFLVRIVPFERYIVIKADNIKFVLI